MASKKKGKGQAPAKAKSSPKQSASASTHASVFDTESVSARKAAVDAARKNKFLSYLSLDDGEHAVVRFMNAKPVTFYQHRAMDPKVGKIRNLTCTRGECPLCKLGSKHRATYKGAFLVLHIDNEVDGKVKPELKLFVRGVNDLSVIEAKNAGKKGPVTNRNLELTRVGEGTSTRYTFDETDDNTIPAYDKTVLASYKGTTPVEVLKSYFAPDKEALDRAAGSHSEGGSEEGSDEGSDDGNEGSSEEEGGDGAQVRW